MILDPRLSVIANLVNKNSVIADIGTDHAYLPANLIISGKIKKAFACDIAEQPLENARETIEKYNLQNNIELILSDGLQNVPHDEIDTIIIAGMGGSTICNILDSCSWAKNTKFNYIFQPMTKHNELRKYLKLNNYNIISEHAVKHKNHLYTIMSTKFQTNSIIYKDYFSSNDYINNIIFEQIGKIKETNSEFAAEYILNVISKYNHIKNGLSISENNNFERINNINQIISILSEILEQ